MKNEKYFFLPVQNIQKQQAKFECCRKNMYNNDKKSKISTNNFGGRKMEVKNLQKEAVKGCTQKVKELIREYIKNTSEK